MLKLTVKRNFAFSKFSFSNNRKNTKSHDCNKNMFFYKLHENVLTSSIAKQFCFATYLTVNFVVYNLQ